MRTFTYNPSVIEQDFANALQAMAQQLQQQLPQYTIGQVASSLEQDNPNLVISLTDSDGDPHELVIKFIQRPDQF